QTDSGFGRTFGGLGVKRRSSRSGSGAETPAAAAGRKRGYPRRDPSLRSRPSAPPRSRPADGQGGPTRTTPSDLPIRTQYTSSDLPPDLAARTPPAGEPPYTRGIHPAMYRSRLWTMRQYAGFGSARQTNERFRFLLGQGQTGLSVAF